MYIYIYYKYILHICKNTGSVQNIIYITYTIYIDITLYISIIYIYIYIYIYTLYIHYIYNIYRKKNSRERKRDIRLVCWSD